jgi:hypothetical protein
MRSTQPLSPHYAAVTLLANIAVLLLFALALIIQNAAIVTP